MDSDVTASLQKKKSSRLVSLDALRGFTMFWIVGGASLIASLEAFGQFGFTNFLINQVDHS